MAAEDSESVKSLCRKKMLIVVCGILLVCTGLGLGFGFGLSQGGSRFDRMTQAEAAEAAPAAKKIKTKFLVGDVDSELDDQHKYTLASGGIDTSRDVNESEHRIAKKGANGKPSPALNPSAQSSRNWLSTFWKKYWRVFSGIGAMSGSVITGIGIVLHQNRRKPLYIIISCIFV